MCQHQWCKKKMRSLLSNWESSKQNKHNLFSQFAQFIHLFYHYISSFSSISNFKVQDLQPSCNYWFRLASSSFCTKIFDWYSFKPYISHKKMISRILWIVFEVKLFFEFLEIVRNPCVLRDKRSHVRICFRNNFKQVRFC